MTEITKLFITSRIFSTVQCMHVQHFFYVFNFNASWMHCCGCIAVDALLW